MEVVQFPPTKGLLDFDGMGIKIDVEQQRESWGTAFTCVQTALRFCNLDHAKAEKAARAFIDADILDETGSQWADTIDYLEATVATMKAALARLEVSEDHALGRTKTPEAPISGSLAQAIVRHKAAHTGDRGGGRPRWRAR